MVFLHTYLISQAHKLMELVTSLTIGVTVVHHSHWNVASEGNGTATDRYPGGGLRGVYFYQIQLSSPPLTSALGTTCFV